MISKGKSLFLVFYLSFITSLHPYASTADIFKDGYDYESIKSMNKSLKAILKTCSGWRLSQLFEIKEFIRHEISFYPVEILFSSGDPRILFLDSNGEIYFSKYIANLNREEINVVLSDLGFTRYN